MSNKRVVTREDFGDRWPLTVDAGELACDGQAVTFTVDGTTYSVNGIAPATGSRAEWSNIEEIWALKPGAEGELGLRVNISPLIERGHELC